MEQEQCLRCRPWKDAATRFQVVKFLPQTCGHNSGYIRYLWHFPDPLHRQKKCIHFTQKNQNWVCVALASVSQEESTVLFKFSRQKPGCCQTVKFCMNCGKRTAKETPRPYRLIYLPTDSRQVCSSAHDLDWPGDAQSAWHSTELQLMRSQQGQLLQTQHGAASDSGITGSWEHAACTHVAGLAPCNARAITTRDVAFWPFLHGSGLTRATQPLTGMQA